MKQLDEINILRPIVIILLILMHSFTMYGGGWPLPEGINNCVPYYWIAKGSYACMLESFTFISGYLFAHTLYLGKYYTFKSLVIKKFKRLIIPSIVFSLLYSFLFYKKSYFSITYLYDLLNGVGHMWYLPMLFWCFIATYFIRKIKIKEINKLLLLFFLSVFSFLPLPFRMDTCCYYLLFFYFGTYIYSFKNKFILNYKYICYLFIAFISLFIIQKTFISYLQEALAVGIINKLIRILLSNYLRVICATIGMFFLYVLSVKLSRTKTISKTVLNFNEMCFGIYLFQQFILKLMYYNLGFPDLCGTYLLPWLGFFITLILSVILSKLLLLTKVGKLLIG